MTLAYSAVANVSGACLDNGSFNAAEAFSASWTLVDGCGSGGVQVTGGSVGTVGLVLEPPQYVDPGQGDFTPTSASALIDGGPMGEANCGLFAEEPSPNGCALNLGLFGGTAGAQSAAQADHCACPPGE